MKYFYFVIISVFTFTMVHAQVRTKEINNPQFGLKMGAVSTKVNNISQVLVSEPYYSNYEFVNKSVYGFTGGLYINYRFEETIMGIYSEFSYSSLGSKLKYSDINDFNYDLTVRYELINWELLFKAYVFDGLHIDIGPKIGFNISPGALFYTSNGEAIYGPDIRQQQQMRDVLKGRSNFSIELGIGYEFGNGLNLDFRYYHGFSDVMETEVNNFHFIEIKNASRALQLTIGYSLPYEL